MNTFRSFDIDFIITKYTFIIELWKHHKIGITIPKNFGAEQALFLHILLLLTYKINPLYYSMHL